MSDDGELRVMTMGQLRQATLNAVENGLERHLSAGALVLLERDGIIIAKVKHGVARGSVPPYYRITAVMKLAGALSEVVVDVMPGDWRALPTVAEFDAELSFFEAAARG